MEVRQSGDPVSGIDFLLNEFQNVLGPLIEFFTRSMDDPAMIHPRRDHLPRRSISAVRVRPHPIVDSATPTPACPVTSVLASILNAVVNPAAVPADAVRPPAFIHREQCAETKHARITVNPQANTCQGGNCVGAGRPGPRNPPL